MTATYGSIGAVGTLSPVVDAAGLVSGLIMNYSIPSSVAGLPAKPASRDVWPLLTAARQAAFQVVYAACVAAAKSAEGF